MLPSKAPPAGAILVVAGNKAWFGGCASLLPVKQALGTAGCVVLAVDGKRTAARLRSVVVGAAAGREDDFSDEDLKPKALSTEKIKKVAEETSSLLREVCVPKDSTSSEQIYFSKELEGLQKVCHGMMDQVGEGNLNEDVAITILIGIQARLRLLLTENKKVEDFLVSSMYETKMSVSDYMSAQNPKPKANYVSVTLSQEGRVSSFFDMINASDLIPPVRTVCSEEEVKKVLHKTLSLLEGVEFELTKSTLGRAGLFYGIRKNCRAFMEEVEKKGVGDKTGSGIMMIHAWVIFILGMANKDFSYDDAADDSLLGSLRRLEIALQDYKVEGGSEDATDVAE